MSNSQTLDGVVILVVDDNADWRELLGEVLTSHGASVVKAGTGLEAMQIVEKAPPDVLLSDIAMPEMDGYTLIRKIRNLEQCKGAKRNFRLPAAAISAFTSADDRRASVSAGFQFHIGKPVDIPRLIETVATLAGRSVLQRPDLPC
jgi:CheY-like chemotaxis protein